jgi:hypothetical protein
MKKFKFGAHMVDETNFVDLVKKLNWYGKQGWEVCSCFSWGTKFPLVFGLKRELTKKRRVKKEGVES